MIKNTAIIYPGVTLGQGEVVEHYAIVGMVDRFHPEGTVLIGDNSYIGAHCTIYNNVIAGNNFDISDQTTIFTNNKFGNNVRIGPKAIIKNGCVIGDFVRINANVFMERVIIGSNVFIGPHTVFTDDFHPPCPKYAECAPKIKVESYVSIGANVTITPGVSIGHHSQIYAGSLVTRDVPPWSVVAGSPAKVIKDFRELKCHALLYNHPFEDWLKATQKDEL